MPTQEAIEALLKLRKEQQQNSTDPFTFTSNRLGQRPVRSITGETEQETEDRIEKDKVSLFQAVGAGLYEFGESASFGLLGFAEIGAEKALGEELDIGLTKNLSSILSDFEKTKFEMQSQKEQLDMQRKLADQQSQSKYLGIFG